MYQVARSYVWVVLMQHRGNVSSAARELKLGRQYFYKVMKKLHINVERDFRSAKPPRDRNPGKRAVGFHARS